MSNSTYIIDVGSLSSKYGTAGREECEFFPSTYVKDKSQQMTEFISPQYFTRFKNYEPNYIFPISNGKVNNFESYILLLDQIIDSLPSEHDALLLTEQELTAGREREMLTEILFERFNFKKVFLAKKPVCAIYADDKSRKRTGIVVHSGENFTSVTPIYDGYAITQPFREKDKLSYAPIGGFNVLKPFISQIQSFFSWQNDERIRFDFLFSKEKPKPIRFVVPDSKKSVQIKYPERGPFPMSRADYSKIMFYKGKETDNCNVVELFKNSIFNLDEDFKEELIKNVVIAGGNTGHFGFGKTFKTLLLEEKLFSDAQVGICYPTSVSQVNNLKTSTEIDPRKVIWHGAKNLVMEPSFESRWAQLDEYNEEGPIIGEMKFF